jgi:3-oxoadipate enol-lactonase
MKARANGIDINYSVEGKGAWVVMSHSLACNLSMWDQQAAQLAQGFRVLRFDTRGHGGSDAPAGPYTLDLLANDLRALLDALGIERPHFVGLSMGGMVGMSFAISNPGRLRSLVLCDTTSRIPPEALPVWQERIKTAAQQGMEPLVEPTLRRWFTEDFYRNNKPVMARVGEMIRRTPVPGYIGCCEAIAKLDLTNRLGEIDCPACVIVGDRDVGTPVAMSRTIQEAIGGAELVVLPSASHLSNLEQPALFDKALSAFLRRF